MRVDFLHELPASDCFRSISIALRAGLWVSHSNTLHFIWVTTELKVCEYSESFKLFDIESPDFSCVNTARPPRLIYDYHSIDWNTNNQASHNKQAKKKQKDCIIVRSEKTIGIWSYDFVTEPTELLRVLPELWFTYTHYNSKMAFSDLRTPEAGLV